MPFFLARSGDPNRDRYVTEELMPHAVIQEAGYPTRADAETAARFFQDEWVELVEAEDADAALDLILWRRYGIA